MVTPCKYTACTQSRLIFRAITIMHTEDCKVLAINNLNGSLFDWLYLQDIANQIYGTLVTQFSILNCIARFHKIPVVICM